MELITYPFSLFIGGLFVLFLVIPFFFWGYKGAQVYVEFLTTGRYKFGRSIDKKLYDGWSSLQTPYEPILVISTILCVLILIFSTGETLDGGASFLENLIYFSFSLPVQGVAFISPVLFPVFILFCLSFGMRKLVSLGYTFNERLAKVEKS